VDVTEETIEEAADGARDEARSALLESLTADLGDAIVGSHLEPGRNLWIRVTNLSWSETADYLRNGQRFRFFDWLSAIDWLQSPFGRSLDAAVDVAAAAAPPEAELTEFSSGDENSRDQAGAVGQSEPGDSVSHVAGGYTGTGADGVTGGGTRFQVLARVYNLSTGLGLNLKADVPETDDGLTIGTWVKTYPGAAWHEREAHEMFGISFTGNADQRNLYLPTDFEGYPLRKDYPLLARLVKPWPGIVDVEPMPEVEGPSANNPEGGQAEESGND
jgi:NADH-quinone oxidoreductase subunit C